MLPLILAFLLMGLGDVYQSSSEQETDTSLGHRIALSLEGELPNLSEDQYQQASSGGIDFLLFNHLEQLQGVPVEPFYLIFQFPIEYPTLSKIESESSQFIREIISETNDLANRYPGKITSVGLFKYPNEIHPRFNVQAAAIADSVKAGVQLPVFFQTALSDGSRPRPQHVDFRVYTDLENNPVQNRNAVHFRPSEDLRESLIRLEQLVVETLRHEESLIILPAEWYFQEISTKPDFEIIFSSYRDGVHIPFPIPYRAETPPAMNWNVIFLFVIFGSILVHARLQPAYLPSLSRYFFNHSFYLEDVLEHRIRNMIPGLIILLQHALTTGVIFYLSAEMLFNSIGLEVLRHHFSSILWTSNPYLSLFIFGFVLAVFLQVISVLWLHLPNKNLRHLSQTLNLYAWPLHINFLVAAIFIVLYGSNPGDTLIASILIAYLFVWFMSFNFAALDASKYLERLKLVYLLVTVGLHILLFGYLFWAAFNFPSIHEPLQMALTFSGH
ncbi:hypothetical protein [Rhodohalobacter halophilus]|uniref:hypothetical protein n=1 Tax=Rhodohalobacter halophilus TaxID=1812810 RepID=UPI00083FD35B|nr:hypothetical protein [Rhodohalobacter halophilus]